ncbi:MAG: DUF3367 domain-containing protein [Nitrososphaerota archaeon]|jgi:hypothetical protein|nr:DUF3367 domain-containing protein [Nitrososphaerota archaeon]MDG7038108.1 DUF3367 domain-containing protein [Nitrososphaerota archaeon]
MVSPHLPKLKQAYIDNIKTFIKNHWSILLILILGLLPLTWYKASILGGGDEGLPPPINIFKDLFYLWQYNNPWLGAPISFYNPSSTPSSLLIPFAIFWSGMLRIGLSISIVQKLWLYTLFTSSGLSMYYLAKAMGMRHQIALLIPALFYMINPYFSYAVTNSGPFNTGIILTYISAPLLLALTVRGLESGNLRYSLYIGIASLVAASTFVTPPRYIATWMPAVFYLLCWFAVKHKKTYALKFSFTAMISTLLVNLYWLITVPSVFKIANNGLNVTNTLSFLYSMTKNAIPFNSFRLLGGWAFNQGWAGSMYYPFAPFYSQFYIVLIGFFITIIAFSSILFIKNDKIFFFGVLALIGIFLADGPNSPFGSVFMWLYLHVPYFYIFRQPHELFIVFTVITYSVLLGFTVEFIAQKAFRKNGHKLVHIFLIILIFLIVLNGFPEINGAVIPGSPRGGTGTLAGFQVNYPPYWIDAANYLRSIENNSYRILLMPPSPPYNWANPKYGYSGPDPAYFLVSTDFASFTTTNIGYPYSYQILNSLDNATIVNNDQELITALQIMNIKYVLFRGDDSASTDNSFPASAAWNTALNESNLFVPVKQFGPLTIYRFKYWKPMAIYYTTNILAENSSASLIIQRLSNYNTTSYAIIQAENYTGIDDNLLTNNQITYREINPTEYIIKVNVTEPFLLVFTQSYSPGWSLLLNNNVDNKHLIVNGYANGWIINQSGLITLKLEYTPEHWFIIGSFVSLITFVILAIYIVASYKWQPHFQKMLASFNRDLSKHYKI